MPETLHSNIQNALTTIAKQLYPVVISETIIPLSDEFKHTDLLAFLKGPVSRCLNNPNNEYLYAIVDYFFDNDLYALDTDTARCFFLDHLDIIKRNIALYEFEFTFEHTLFKAIFKDRRMESILISYYANI